MLCRSCKSAGVAGGYKSLANNFPGWFRMTNWTMMSRTSAGAVAWNWTASVGETSRNDHRNRWFNHLIITRSPCNHHLMGKFAHILPQRTISGHRHLTCLINVGTSGAGGVAAVSSALASKTVLNGRWNSQDALWVRQITVSCGSWSSRYGFKSPWSVWYVTLHTGLWEFWFSCWRICLHPLSFEMSQVSPFTEEKKMEKRYRFQKSHGRSWLLINVHISATTNILWVSVLALQPRKRSNWEGQSWTFQKPKRWCSPIITD